MGALRYVGIALLGGGLGLAFRAYSAKGGDPAMDYKVGALFILIGVACYLLHRFYSPRGG